MNTWIGWVFARFFSHAQYLLSALVRMHAGLGRRPHVGCALAARRNGCMLVCRVGAFFAGPPRDDVMVFYARAVLDAWRGAPTVGHGSVPTEERPNGECLDAVWRSMGCGDGDELGRPRGLRRSQRAAAIPTGGGDHISAALIPRAAPIRCAGAIPWAGAIRWAAVLIGPRKMCAIVDERVSLVFSALL